VNYNSFLDTEIEKAREVFDVGFCSGNIYYSKLSTLDEGS
jgi:hypothetical protein